MIVQKRWMKIMYNAQLTYDRIDEMAKLRGISIGKINEMCSLSKNAISNAAKSEFGMKAKNIVLISEILNVSTDYLLGRTDNPEVTGGNHALSGDGGVAVASGDANNITISNGNQKTEKDKEDMELLELIESLPLKKRVKIISMIYDEIENQ